MLVSSTYRNYLDDVVRMERVLNNGISYSDSRYTSPGFLPFNPAMRDFHNAMATFDLAALRDWAVVNALMVAYRNDPFDRVDAVYALFMKEAIVPEYRDSLIAFRQRMLRVKPGVKAPAISLKDEKGKLVSLDDFKGKLVYLDFWGVYCGPCIGDIEGYAAKIHARYKDKPVVFVTICADAKPEKWKETLAKYKMDGVNLHAADGRRSDVLDNYGVNGIPHYFLIDENGIILDNNAPRLSELDRTENNTLDKALGKLTASK
ncbi:TlpA family protein disulfide reductase [Chitinophaga sedimenti]|uniref:TlpA family protein disulfide reductase n=1 Tax=Chitinophaga sedimenti TaxID=2033606 RepID=UPI002003D8E0|nr:TlpA disulfide reductase family protein [Chitinophaga sedimenti]MCK7557769.1 TlpA family protein disulfide reductase [Chitinophaga sedimenti]